MSYATRLLMELMAVNIAKHIKIEATIVVVRSEGSSQLTYQDTNCLVKCDWICHCLVIEISKFSSQQ